MPAAVFMGLRTWRSRTGPRPQPGPGRAAPRGQPLRDLRLRPALPRRVGRPHRRDRGPRVLGHGRRARRRRDRLGGRRPGRRRASRPSAASASTASRAASSLCVERGSGRRRRQRLAGRVRRLQGRSRAAEALRVPDHLSLKHAALAEPLAVALHGITQAGGARPGTRWLVTGGGPIGFLSVAALKALGVDDIVVSEPKESRRELCEKLGARVDRRPTSSTTPAMPHDLVDEPFDVALECSGNGRGQESALAQLKRAGTLVLVGAGMARPKFDPNRILLNELVITGAFVYDADGFVARARAARVGQAAERPARRAGGLPAEQAARHGARAARGNGRGQGHDRPARRLKEHA